MPDLTVAQNIFIGREPRGAGVFLDERALNRRDRASCSSGSDLPLDPREPRRRPHGRASSRWSRSPRRCRFDAQVLIMDEPTAALNDAEVDGSSS